MACEHHNFRSPVQLTRRPPILFSLCLSFWTSALIAHWLPKIDDVSTLAWPHLEMKKLHHELELVVELVPDEQKIKDCVAPAAAGD